MKLNKKIGNFIRNARVSKGLSEKELASLISVSQQQVSRYERGVSTLSIQNILILLNALNIPFDEFSHKIIKPEQNRLFDLLIEELETDGVINVGNLKNI
ncbi:helix-turn-helix domain-containing protein [Providencia alcalifaciens]|uniref:DNA-binding helix-turn-helix protein n=1 Tax=Providencia alcalifaciens DSM 30120 TaxID=520999 RepID=B6XAL9_9GAMM|nr:MULTISPECIES: helix-turn-helix transcriptional regulator [Providencia]ATG14865.1 XRE family transcriptional regulator [Providencia alcalifaciens]EEB47772.1 DNA-binding helix-turn-helix protein [Providencia alcalifaciens DSM 30120]EKT64713.1 fimbrial operon regulator [Providencia alcalifaciens Dmel2]MBF0691209.1 helix-turn-helix transcriptional regulator [Providencia alcalifaciens]MTC28367.1 helix-turn-helix domain-containing protein [Providencia alcalifaciens]